MAKSNKNIILEVKALSYKYPKSDEYILKDINFTVNKGEHILVCGSSGSGKSTLSKCLNGIFPHLSDGKLEGDVIINGKNIQHYPICEFSSEIGMVFQNPEEQIFSIRVDNEVALGVEMQGFTRDEIVRRVDYALNKLKIDNIKNNITFTLSGGQKQKVSIASNLAVLPSILVLDEPTTDLDPISKQEVVDTLYELKKDIDTTFIIIEHDLTDLLDFVDRVIVLDKGKIIADGKTEDVFYNEFYKLDEIGIRIPDHIRLAKYLLESGYEWYEDSLPTKKSKVLEWLKTLLEYNKISFPQINHCDYTSNSNETVLKIENVKYTYKSSDKTVLKNINLEIKKGEFLGIVGHNGSGKSTLLKIILGLIKTKNGSILINNKDARNLKMEDLILDIGYVFQNPDNQLFCNTVKEEIEFGLKNRNFSEDFITAQRKKVLKIVGLEEKESNHPFSLSRGERQRLAVATMLVTNPKIIILDEPTTGQDSQNLEGLLKLLSELANSFDATIIMVTHDMDVLSRFASRIVVINDGNIVLEGSCKDIFCKHYNRLKDLKLKPPVISEISAQLSEFGMPYIPNWESFEKNIHNIESHNSMPVDQVHFR